MLAPAKRRLAQESQSLWPEVPITSQASSGERTVDNFIWSFILSNIVVTGQLTGLP